MQFWDYKDDGLSDVKKKTWLSAMVAKSHYLFRKYMGAVDQSDVKASIMGLTMEGTPKWHAKQLAFCVESAIASCHSNYNLDPSTQKAEFFMNFHDYFISEMLELSKDFRKYKTKKQRKRKLEELPSDTHLSRSHKKKKPQAVSRHRKTLQYGYATEAG